MQLFYEPNIENKLSLSDEEARHCFKVLRKNEGDEIVIVDGKGTFFTCLILDSNPKKNKLQIISTQKERESKNKIHLIVAPTKNLDRTEWLVEKSVEIGVDEITFILTTNSERRVLKLERILKKAVSAMKQSVKSKLPQINELILFEKLVLVENNNLKYIAHLDNEAIRFNAELTNNINNNVNLFIGPEGGFTKEEISLALSKDIKPVYFGGSRLRTETACVYALSILNQ